MNRPAAFVLAIFFFLFLIHNTMGYTVRGVSFENGKAVSVEPVKDPEDQRIGLMHRDGLEDGWGMLFVFDREDSYSFWMANMSFSIDIVWVGSDMRIVDFTESARPCSEAPCPVYSSSVPAKYVIELPAGFACDNSLSRGQKIAFLEDWNQ